MPSNPLAEVQKIFEPWRQAHRRDAWRAVIEKELQHIEIRRRTDHDRDHP
jgi:hypothetical protein